MSTKEPPAPPPVIGKIGPYTVFLTPPPPSHSAAAAHSPAVIDSHNKVTLHAPPPPVQPPPAQFDHLPSEDRLGFLRQYFTKLQTWHESIDEFMANWLGLNQSKFQWALDDYYEANPMVNAPRADMKDDKLK